MDLGEVLSKLQELESTVQSRMLQPSISERERRLYLNLLERILRSQGNVTKSMKIERLEVEVESLKQIMGGDKV
jgi:hypothetical protein